MAGRARRSGDRSENGVKLHSLPRIVLCYVGSRCRAIRYHFCVALEMSTYPYTVDPDLVMAMGRHVLEASMRAIPGIYRKVSGCSRGANGSVQPCCLC